MSEEAKKEEAPKSKRAPRKSDRPTQRPPRVRMTAGGKLFYPEHLKDDNYAYRWFEDKPGRLLQAEAAYWEPVLHEDGTQWMVPGPKNMYLKRIPKEYFEEDKKLKEQRIVNTMKEENKLGEDEYIPEGRSGAIQQDSDLHDPLA